MKNILLLFSWIYKILAYIIGGLIELLFGFIVGVYVASGFGALIMLGGLFEQPHPRTITYVFCVLNVIVWLYMIVNDIKIKEKRGY